MAAPGSMRSFETLLRWGQRGFSAVAVVAIATYLLLNRVAVFDLFVAANPQLITASIVIMALVHIPVATGFHFAHSGLGVQRRYVQTLSSYFARLPARYIPGGIWHTAARYFDISAQQDLPKRVFAQIFVVESCLVGASGLMVAGVFGRIWFGEGEWIYRIGTWALLASVFLVFSLAGFVRWFGVQLRPDRMLIAGTLFTLHWVVVGLGFALYARALIQSPFGTCSYGILASTYELAASVGYIAIFSPQGWGVSEWVFAKLGTCNTSLITGVAAIAGFRLIGLVADLFAFSAVLATNWVRSLRNRAKSDDGDLR